VLNRALVSHPTYESGEPTSSGLEAGGMVVILEAILDGE